MHPDAIGRPLLQRLYPGMIGRARLSVPFTALKVNGHAGTATFANGGDMAMTWTLAAHQQVGNGLYSYAHTDCYVTLAGGGGCGGGGGVSSPPGGKYLI